MTSILSTALRVAMERARLHGSPWVVVVRDNHFKVSPRLDVSSFDQPVYDTDRGWADSWPESTRVDLEKVLKDADDPPIRVGR